MANISGGPVDDRFPLFQSFQQQVIALNEIVFDDSKHQQILTAVAQLNELFKQLSQNKSEVEQFVRDYPNGARIVQNMVVLEAVCN